MLRILFADSYLQIIIQCQCFLNFDWLISNITVLTRHIYRHWYLSCRYYAFLADIAKLFTLKRFIAWLKTISHNAIFFATCNAMALHCKLQGRFPCVTPHVCNQSRNKKLHCKLQRKQKQLLLFAMLRDKLQRVTPPTATCLAIF